MMLTNRNEYQTIFAYLRSLNFHYLESWVVECVNYYKTANPNISLEVLKNEVKQQWLLANLREIKVPSLPPNLKAQQKIILNGSYAVQVESMIDSSKSCYSQFQKLLKVDLENVKATEKTEENHVDSKRCLTFVVSDGVQEVEAMEYHTITKIKSNDPDLLPGFKMVIIGPVECRKGMILLKDENVRMCGGEVDSLIVSNSLRNILIRKLELDESEYADVALSMDDNATSAETVQCDSGISGNLKDDCIESLLSQNDDVFLSVSLEPEVLGPENRATTQLNEEDDNNIFSDNIDFWNEDEFMEGISMCNSKKHNLSPEELETSRQKRPSLDPDIEVMDISQSDWSPTTQPTSSKSVQNNISTSFLDKSQSSNSKAKTKKPIQTKVSSFFKNSDTKLNNASCSHKNLHNNVCVSEYPFVYLRQIISKKLEKCSVFTIKGVILTLKKKIIISNSEFNLKATITDGSAAVDMSFCSEILETFLGFSPEEMKVMIKAKQTNSVMAQRVKESFSVAQEKLISLNCLLNVKFFTDDTDPVVLSLEELSDRHLQGLKNRSVQL